MELGLGGNVFRVRARVRVRAVRKSLRLNVVTAIEVY